MDRKVKNDRVTVVVSAGNYGTPCGGNGNIITPGKAYSIITVGAVNELGTTQWNDDEIWSCQSVTDPVSFFGDRVKPEVVAPGVDIRTTITGPPWVHVAPDPGLDGTSFAAPHVTGQVSLMIARARSLRHRPEVNKAIVISSNRLIFNYDRESQGAGAIVADWADNIVAGVRGGWGEVIYDCTYSNPYLAVTLPNLLANARTRVAIVWSQHPTYVGYNSQPSADLNLEVRDPVGNVVSGFGNSHDDTYEWVEWITSNPGNYTLHIYRRYCDSVPNSLVAYAYYQQ